MTVLIVKLVNVDDWFVENTMMIDIKHDCK